MIEPDKTREAGSAGHTECQAILNQTAKPIAPPSAATIDLEKTLEEMEEAIANEGGILTP